MAKLFSELPVGDQWRCLVNCARQGLEDSGYTLRKVPGMGRQNVWAAKKGKVEKRVSIRTTRDRWIAFPPLPGNKWKTLDDVDLVAVAAVNDADHPRKAEVFLFPAEEVKRRFNEAYAARMEAGNKVTFDFGMWVSLDAWEPGSVGGVGSGIVDNFEPLAVYSLEPVQPESAGPTSGEDDLPNVDSVLLNARQAIAAITGVPVERIRLELRIGS